MICPVSVMSLETAKKDVEASKWHQPTHPNCGLHHLGLHIWLEDQLLECFNDPAQSSLKTTVPVADMYFPSHKVRFRGILRITSMVVFSDSALWHHGVLHFVCPLVNQSFFVGLSSTEDPPASSKYPPVISSTASSFRCRLRSREEGTTS